MSRFRSTALAALFGLGVAGFSGHLTSASAEPVNPAATTGKLHAESAGLNGQLSTRPAQDPAATSQDKDAWGSQVITGGQTGWDIRSRTGFFGYR